jgi:hypothetical protein
MPEPTPQIKKKVRIIVDYDLSLKEMLALGHYSYVDKKINPAFFPSSNKGKKEIFVELVHFDCLMLSGEVIGCLKKMTLRPATITELLAFGAINPNERRFSPVLALSSTALVSGERQIPCLKAGFSGRALCLLCWSDLWRNHCRFLAIHP